MLHAEPDWSVPPQDEIAFLDWFSWERCLSPRDRWRLAFARSTLEPGDGAAFSLNHAAKLSSPDFQDDLELAGDDLVERATIRLEAELDSYPNR